MNDDDRLIRLLREQADARIPDQQPPAFVAGRSAGAVGPGTADRRRRSPWLLPLLAAACVCVLLGGTFGAVQLLSGPSRPALDPDSTQTPTAPLSTTFPTSAPSTSVAPTSAPSRTLTTAPTGSGVATTLLPPPPTRRSSTGSQSDRRSQPVVAPVTTTHSSAASPATVVVVRRPVTASGHAAAGYPVTSEASSTECLTRSLVTVDRGVDSCGSSAEYTLACWPDSTRKNALCLRDARKHALVRQTLDEAFVTTSAPALPVPLDLTLDNGVGCSLRGGGAGDRASDHPTWVNQYYCSNGTSLFGPPDGKAGIDRSTRQWTVHAYAVNGTGRGRVLHVATAYFVGTA